MKKLFIFLACIFLYVLGIFTGMQPEKKVLHYVKTKHQTIEMDSVHYVIIYTYQFEK